MTQRTSSPQSSMDVETCSSAERTGQDYFTAGSMGRTICHKILDKNLLLSEKEEHCEFMSGLDSLQTSFLQKMTNFKKHLTTQLANKGFYYFLLLLIHVLLGNGILHLITCKLIYNFYVMCFLFGFLVDILSLSIK